MFKVFRGSFFVLTKRHHHVEGHGGRETHGRTQEALHGLRVAVLSELICTDVL